MNCSTKNLNANYYSSVDEIPSKVWSSLNANENVYFKKSFLKSIEDNHQNLDFFYVVLLDKNGNPKCFGSIQIIDFYFETVKNDLESFSKKIKKFGQKLHLFPKKKPFKLLICGNTFVSGEHGVFIADGFNKKQTIKELAKAILNYINSNEEHQIDAFLFKDFVNESLSITNELKDYNYHPFSAEPNMVLHIDENWRTFDNYLRALKTKFRVKAKKALKLSKSLSVKDVTKDSISQQLSEMERLYKKVAKNASFNISDFNLNTYQQFMNQLDNNYVIKTYYSENKMVGFMSGVINNDSLDAHFVGIDYSLNKELAIYQRMLYDYIKIAIDNNLKTLNFGRTASEIKSSVGAEPQDLTMYLRHKKSITNKIIKLFLMRVQPTPFRQNLPFKNKLL
ncbi:peptidogalycan biosysnthesis protein [Polaribacter sp.]|uniref:peptidogalycan biosysnthesis protein n=1 Tax=Polaribacter sp. TaxID=1920175 RepID=UPI0025D50B09|nr:peptidogalycan biosysnthesis protein [Polaribacter sp.]